MATVKKIRFADGEPERMLLTISGSNVHISLDGREVAALKGFAEMRQGWKATLDDGRIVEVRTVRRVLLPELSVLVDGRHAIDSPSSPRKMLRGSAEGLLIGGGIFALMTLTGRWSANAYSITLQALQIAGALLLFRRLYLGLVLVGVALAADLLVIDIQLITAPSLRLLWIVAARILFIAFLVRAFIALRDVRREGTLAT